MSDVQFVTEPSVYVTARLLPQFGEIDRFLDDHGFGGEKLLRADSVEVPITMGSRCCYQSFDAVGREHGDHVRHLVEVQHGSCLEHCVWQVLLSGVSRACGRELLRHRHLSPSELSQRYCDLRYCRFVVPPKLLPRFVVGETGTFVRACHDAAEAYAAMLPEKPTKKDREAARSVLPECVETRIVFTGNARAFRNCLERRCHSAADAEIRRVCNKLFNVLSEDAPNCFADYTKHDLGDGTFEIETKTRGV